MVTESAILPALFTIAATAKTPAQAVAAGQNVSKTDSDCPMVSSSSFLLQQMKMQM